MTATTLTASEARANLYRLMDQTAESHQPVTIVGKRNDSVLVSAEDWQAIQQPSGSGLAFCPQEPRPDAWPRSEGSVE